MTDITTKTIVANIINTTPTIKASVISDTPTFKANVVLMGADGKEVELQATATHIQWRYVDGVWEDLVALADLKGADGTNGTDGADGTNGTDGDDGNGIASVVRTAGTGAAGTTDTYTITFTDTNTTTFNVYNGANGTGAGDMLTTTYDINGNGIVDNAEKVNGKTVEENVPSGAVFTDTVTTVNGNTGAIVKADITALGIPAQDTIYTHPNHSGDVTSVADGAQTISNNVVDNTKLAQVAVNIIKGRKTAGTGNVEDLTVSDVLAMLDVYTQTEADNLLTNKAPLSSPALTGTPTAPTATTGTDTTQIASTEFVQQEIDVHKAETLSDGAHGGKVTEMISFTAPSATGVVQLNYPSGFNHNNCMPIVAYINYSGEWWRLEETTASYGLTPTKIHVNFLNVTDLAGNPAKILVAKY